jgi:branched-chain amino acid aminotransferase
MDNSTQSNISIQKISKTRINETDFGNLVFGKDFSDHMYECEFKNGTWQNPSIRPYGDLTMSPSAKVFHYGQAVFEGMKAYKDNNGEVFLFRPDENQARINKSSKRMAIPEFPKELFFEALEHLLELDKDWVKPGMGNSLYIRPFAIATQAGVSASPSDEYKFIIIMSPVNAYYTGDVKVEIAEHYSRSANGGVGAAKAAGNYGAQFYPTNLARERGFQQVIWTDANEHKYLEEAGTMNVFFRINDTLITAPTSDRILDGVTRKSIIALAERDGIAIEVRPIKVSEVIDAAKDGTLKEIFGAGTAAVVSPVSAFGYKKVVYDLPSTAHGYSAKFKKELTKIQYNLSEDTFGWRYKI